MIGWNSEFKEHCECKGSNLPKQFFTSASSCKLNVTIMIQAIRVIMIFINKTMTCFYYRAENRSLS